MELLPPSVLLLCLFQFASSAGDLESTLRHCCRLGRKEERCSNVAKPGREVPQEHLGMCLTAMEICCVETERAKQCSLGQTDAKDGQDCVSLPGISGDYRKECCNACKLGLIMASMGTTCASHETLFGSPWNLAYMSCCQGSNPVPVLTARPPIPVAHTPNEIEDDLNVCDLYPGQLCGDICIPTPGKSFVCACKDGFKLDVDGKTCTILPDNDRCRVNNPCSQRCADTGSAVECSCNPGYRLAADKKTCNDVDECASSNACQLAGMTCKNEPGTFVCLTPDGAAMQPGSLGATTGPDLDECVIYSKICGQNFTCVNTIGSYFCDSLIPDVSCNLGFKYSLETKTCEDIDECEDESNVCRQKGEKCLNTMGSFICHVASRQCPAGFKYDTNQRKCLDVDECGERIHSCLETDECVNTIGGYECVAAAPDSSPHDTDEPDCQFGLEFNTTLGVCVDINECALGLDTCDRASETCVNVFAGFNCTSVRSSSRWPHQPTFSWTTPRPSTSPRPPVFQAPVPTCRPGFKYNQAAKNCVDFDECVESQVPVCDSNQECVNSMGSYRCICKLGFTTDPNTLACVDVNECQLDSHDCTVGQRCDNTIGSYKCFRLTSCGTGYTLNAHTGICEDDNECLLRTDNCATLGPKFQCKNTAGSFRCVPKTCEGKKVINNRGECVDHNCGVGFESNNFGRCVDVNECLGNPCRENEKCVNTQGSFSCTRRIDCGRGYEMNPEGTRCVDVDECAKGTHHCTSNQQCYNTQGSYSCQCPTGYSINNNKQCVDIDECTSLRGNFQLCSSNSVCQNIPGSYRCNCKEGFRHQNDDKVCHDIDECAMGPGLCQHNCLNTWGSFRCSCNPGYTMQSDGRSCHDIDECAEFRDRHLCIGQCQNTPGSYKCRCPEGYRIGADERTCVDIDECSTTAGICRADQVCLNTRGSYQCNSIYCPPDYTRDTDHKNRCKKNTLYCREGDQDCIRQPQTISNNYMTFVSNTPIPPIGYQDLFTMRGPHWSSTGVRFNLELVSARAPAGVTPVTKDFFRVRRQAHNQAIISMVQSIKGPQQIELHLNMDILHNGIFSGTVLAKLFIVVSEHEF